MEDKTLELQMIAALNTTQYCKENNINEWEKYLNGDEYIEVYSKTAQVYFNTQIVNLICQK